MYDQPFQRSMAQPDMVANPAVRGQLNREKHIISLSSFAPENLLSSETGSAVPSRVSLLVPHTQFESGAYSRIPPAFRNGVHINIPPTAIGSVSSL